MKNWLLLLFISFLGSARAANYYFSSESGADSRTSFEAHNFATPWKSLSKLNSYFSSLQPGDSVLLKRGETFYGSIIATKAGTLGKSIVVGAYGTGNKPIVTGFTTITSWTNLGNGVYESTSAVSTLAQMAMVTINGGVYPMGRWPKVGATNKGYLTYQSGTNGSLTTSAISGASSFVGGEAAIRFDNYTTDRCVITAQSSNSVTYTPQSGKTPKSGWGFFFENHPNTLTQPNTTLGEWYYNPSSHKFRMYFGSASPSSYTVKVSTIDNLATAAAKSYITFDNISFQGANKYGLYITTGTGCVVKNCDVIYSGVHGIVPASTTGFIADRNYVDWAHSGGIQAGYQTTGATITNNTVKHTGMFAGMQWKKSGDDVINGIRVATAGSLVKDNIIIAAGWNGIRANMANNLVIDGNYIDSISFIKQDAGGIYTWTGGGTHTNSKIVNNTVLNSIGAPEGTGSTASWGFGIYLDDRSDNIELANNTVFNAERGLFLHNNLNVNAHDNVTYNCGIGLKTTDDLSGYGKGLTIKNNIFFAKSPTQMAADFRKYSAATFSGMGVIDFNYYCRPILETVVIKEQTTSSSATQTLAAWQSYSKFDLNSRKTIRTINNQNKIRFEYNATGSTKTVSLGSTKYTSIKSHSIISGSIQLAPHSSIILLDTLSNTSSALSPRPLYDPGHLVIGYQELLAYPNPTSSKATITFMLPEDTDYSLKLCDMTGSQMNFLKRGKALAGKIITVNVDCSRFSKGIYTVFLLTSLRSKTFKLVVN